MKILVTGGAGFIARNLTDQLSDEYNIASPDSKELDLLDSAKVFDYIRLKAFDIIIHTATYDAAPKHSIKDPAKVLENNLKMFFNIARCKDYFGKLIYFGSGAEFGRENWLPRMKEDYFDKHIPADQYGFSKYIMTKYAQSNSNIYNLRLFGVFGKYDDWRTRFISNACCRAVSGQAVVINQNRFFDFIYINDLVKIVKWFIRNKPQQSVYNTCSGKTIDFKSLAEMIVRAANKRLDIIIEADGLGREYSGDNTLLLKEMNGFKFNPIEDSIKELYNWHDLNKQILENKI